MRTASQTDRVKELQQIQLIAKECINCGTCAGECAFLEQLGTPGDICKEFLNNTTRSSDSHRAIFACNLCGLCTTVCPKKLDTPGALLEIRRISQKSSQLSSSGSSICKEHHTICSYEDRGASSLFSLHLFPEGCDAVFFPGCTLTATRASVTEAIYERLCSIDPNLGVVLDCCAKPSHDLGLDERFTRAFSRIRKILRANNIKKIYTGCPSCYASFSNHAPEFSTISVYQVLALNSIATIPSLQNWTESITIHDSCTARNVKEFRESVRTLLTGTGAEVKEMIHSGTAAICCGEGGSATFVAPDITSNWKTIRKTEANGRRVVTYCAGCSAMLGKDIKTTHILDLLFDPEKARVGQEKVTKTPLTYASRFFLKQRLKNKIFPSRLDQIISRFLPLPLASSSKFRQMVVGLIFLLPIVYLLKHLIV